MKVLPEQLRLYAVTDRSWLGDQTLAEQVEAALKGGATFVQLREKELDHESFVREAREIKEICARYKVPFVINDDVDVCIEVDADGVHVGQEDLEAGRARALLGPDKIIGVSTHNPEEAKKALENGADYLGCGAIFATGSKENVIRITPEILKDVTAAVDIPVVGIGGISRDNMSQLNGCGLAGVAVISAIFAQQDIEAAARELKAMTEKL